MKVVLSVFLYLVNFYVSTKWVKNIICEAFSLSLHLLLLKTSPLIMLLFSLCLVLFFFLFLCLYYVPEIRLLFQFLFNSYIFLSSYNSTSELVDVFHPRIFPTERIILVMSPEPLNPICVLKCLALKIKDNPFKSQHISFWLFQTSLPQLLLISEAVKVWTTAAPQYSAELPKPQFWARLISTGRPLCRCGYANSHPQMASALCWLLND